MDRKQIISGMIILGLVLTILEYFIADDLPVSLFIIYTTFYLSLTVVFVTEYKYYRNHDAIPASSQFLVIPLCIMLVGSFIIPNSIGKDYLEIPIWSTKFELFTSSKITSLSLIPPFFIIGKLLNNFYQGTYSGFVVRRRIHGPTKLPLFFHLIIVILFLTSIFL
ncbi:MAG: hypothetical protein OEZ01_00635, partial [Candidatus Heimdallarchaeota archaeon]|nr:hypothetical protein [Candidatus Heimdallarchaeota archaeon]